MPTLSELDLDALVGRRVDEARAAITEAGGILRAVSPDQAVTADYRSHRVTLLVEDGRVIRNLGIG
ncbi:MAG: hypothetical protein M3070_02050 [Actinomycetota bacterium]|nr:hypothetical protein [Actinomycetota bacterium]